MPGDSTERKSQASSGNQERSDVNLVAFRCLADLLKRKLLTQKQYDMFSAKYRTMHQIVLQTYDNEQGLLKMAKRKHEELSAATLKAKALETQLMQQELVLTEEKEALRESTEDIQFDEESCNVMQYELSELLRDVDEIETLMQQKINDIADLYKPQFTSLSKALAELDDELVASDAHIEKEDTARSTTRSRILHIKEGLQEAVKTKATLRRTLTRSKHLPEKLRSQALVAHGGIENLKQSIGRLDGSLAKLQDELDDTLEDNRELNSEVQSKQQSQNNIARYISQLHYDLDDVKRRTELEVEKRFSFLEDRAIGASTQSSLRQQIRHSQKVYLQYQRQYDSVMARHERVSRKLEGLTKSSLPHLQQAHTDLTRRLAHQRTENAYQVTSLKDMKQGVDVSISELLITSDDDATLASRLDVVKVNQTRIDGKVGESVKVEQSRKERVRRLQLSRGDMARRTCRIGVRLQSVDEEMKVCNLMHEDYSKQRQFQRGKLKGYQQIYDSLQSQKAQFAKKSQQCTKALADMHERTSVLTSQIDVMDAEAATLNGRLDEKSKELLAHRFLRDQLKLEIAARKNSMDAREAEAKQCSQSISKRETTVKRRDGQAVHLRGAFKKLIANRNHFAVALIDRNDELSILFEKLGVLETSHHNGDEQLKSISFEVEDIRRGTMSVKLRCEALAKQLPCPQEQRKFAVRFEELEKKLGEQRTGASKLSVQLEGVERDSEFPSPRFLAGIDPDGARSGARIEVLEAQLSHHSTSLMEKKLIVDEVKQLSSELRSLAADSYESTLALTERTNEHQYKLKRLTRLLMSTCSELSMYQATCLKLEQKRAQLQESAAEATSRMNRGLPPTEVAEHDWIRMERIRHRREADLLLGEGPLRPFLTEQDRPMTASKRANAYIPDELGIPKPYGPYLPFHPSKLGSQMRHMKNPQVGEVVV